MASRPTIAIVPSNPVPCQPSLPALELGATCSTEGILIVIVTYFYTSRFSSTRGWDQAGTTYAKYGRLGTSPAFGQGHRRPAAVYLGPREPDSGADACLDWGQLTWRPSPWLSEPLHPLGGLYRRQPRAGHRRHSVLIGPSGVRRSDTMRPGCESADDDAASYGKGFLRISVNHLLPGSAGDRERKNAGQAHLGRNTGIPHICHPAGHAGSAIGEDQTQLGLQVEQILRKGGQARSYELIHRAHPRAG